MTEGRNLGRNRNEEVTGNVVTGGRGILESDIKVVTTSTTSTTKNNNNNNSRYMEKLTPTPRTYRRNQRFVVWLRKQVGRPDAIGDLASDTLLVVSPLGHTAGYHALEAQMRSFGACGDAMAALERAHVEFLADAPC